MVVKSPMQVAVVIAADPLAIETALDTLSRVGIGLQELHGGVDKLKVFGTPGRGSVRSRAAAAELGLTERQLSVLELTAEGMSASEMGTHLGLSVGTVKVHMGRLFKRLGVNERTAAVAAGFRAGILGGAR